MVSVFTLTSPFHGKAASSAASMDILSFLRQEGLRGEISAQVLSRFSMSAATFPGISPAKENFFAARPSWTSAALRPYFAYPLRRFRIS